MNAPQTYTQSQRDMLGETYDTTDSLLDLLDIEQYRAGEYQVDHLRRMLGLSGQIHSELTTLVLDVLQEQLPTAGEAESEAAAVNLSEGLYPPSRRELADTLRICSNSFDAVLGLMTPAQLTALDALALHDDDVAAALSAAIERGSSVRVDDAGALVRAEGGTNGS